MTLLRLPLTGNSLCVTSPVADGRDGGWGHKCSRKQLTELIGEGGGGTEVGAGDSSGAGGWHRKSYVHPFRMTFFGCCNMYVYVCMKLLVTGQASSVRKNNTARQSVPSLPEMVRLSVPCRRKEPRLESSRSGMATLHLNDPCKFSPSLQSRVDSRCKLAF